MSLNFASSRFSEAPLNHLCLSSDFLVHHLFGAIYFSARKPVIFIKKQKIVTVRTFGENDLSSRWFCPVLDQLKFSLSHGSMWLPRIIQANWAVCGIWEWRHSSNSMYGSSQKLYWHTSCSYVKMLFYTVNCYCFPSLTFWNQVFWGKKYSCT